MINVYPVKVEAYLDDDNDHMPMFRIEAFDENVATITIETVIYPGEELEDLFQAIREGLKMMKLDSDNVPDSEKP